MAMMKLCPLERHSMGRRNNLFKQSSGDVLCVGDELRDAVELRSMSIQLHIIDGLGECPLNSVQEETTNAIPSNPYVQDGGQRTRLDYVHSTDILPHRALSFTTRDPRGRQSTG